MFGTMENMHMSVQTILQHTLRFFDGDSRSASVSRTSEAESCSAAALSFASVGSTAMTSAFSDGWDDIFLVFTATRFFADKSYKAYFKWPAIKRSSE